jgi:hypothetical protein
MYIYGLIKTTQTISTFIQIHKFDYIITTHILEILLNPSNNQRNHQTLGYYAKAFSYHKYLNFKLEFIAKQQKQYKAYKFTFWPFVIKKQQFSQSNFSSATIHLFT